MQNTAKPKLVLSFDVEATGDAPGKGSMVMLGVVAVLDQYPENFVVTEENTNDWIVAEKQWCLDELDGRGERCWNQFWTKNMPVWEYIQKHKVHPSVAMEELDQWLKELSNTYTLSWGARPAAYDWQWLNYTWEHYLTKEDRQYLGFKAECMNAYKIVAALLGYNSAAFEQYVTPKKLILTHNAVDDARSQAYTFLKSKQWMKENFTKRSAELLSNMPVSLENTGGALVD